MTTVPNRATALRTRWASQRGAQLLEFAVSLPILAGLALGALDFGNAYNTLGGVRYAAREGVRLATVNAVAFTGTCQRFGGATLAPANDAERLYCLTKQKTSINQADTKVSIALSSSGNVGDTVTVCVQTPARSISGIFPMLNSKTLGSKVDMRIEQAPTYSAWNPDGASC